MEYIRVQISLLAGGQKLNRLKRKMLHKRKTATFSPALISIETSLRTRSSPGR